MRGQPEHDTRPHASLSHSFLDMDAWMTSQLNVALIRKLRGSLVCLAYFLTFYPYVFATPGTSRRPVDWCNILMCVLYMKASQLKVALIRKLCGTLVYLDYL